MKKILVDILQQLDNFFKDKKDSEAYLIISLPLLVIAYIAYDIANKYGIQIKRIMGGKILLFEPTGSKIIFTTINHPRLKENRPKGYDRNKYIEIIDGDY